MLRFCCGKSSTKGTAGSFCRCVVGGAISCPVSTVFLQLQHRVRSLAALSTGNYGRDLLVSA